MLPCADRCFKQIGRDLPLNIIQKKLRQDLSVEHKCGGRWQTDSTGEYQ